MPTCERCTVRIIDHGGKYDRAAADVRFVFGTNDLTGLQVIASLEILPDNPAQGTSTSTGALAPADGLWRMFGSTRGGVGRVIIDGKEDEQRVFLITRFRAAVPGDTCCHAKEVVLAKKLEDLSSEEQRLLLVRALAILSSGRDEAELSCDEANLAF